MPDILDNPLDGRRAPSAQHTPGPWCVSISADNAIAAVQAVDPKDGLRFELCEVWGEDFDKSVTPMSKANARLIAAAPDMLAALRLAAVEIQQDLESLIRTEARGTTNWTITDPLPPDEAFDGDPGIPELVRDKHVALTAVVAAIAKAGGR